VLDVFGEVFQALEKPWRSDVFLAPLAPRFFRLTLQLLRRFQLWYDGNTDVRESAGPRDRSLGLPRLEDVVEGLGRARGGGVQLVGDRPQDLLVLGWDLHVFATVGREQLLVAVGPLLEPPGGRCCGLSSIRHFVKLNLMFSV
jgi:hypothetical protein